MMQGNSLNDARWQDRAQPKVIPFSPVWNVRFSTFAGYFDLEYISQSTESLISVIRLIVVSHYQLRLHAATPADRAQLEEALGPHRYYDRVGLSLHIQTDDARLIAFALDKIVHIHPSFASHRNHIITSVRVGFNQYMDSDLPLWLQFGNFEHRNDLTGLLFSRFVCFQCTRPTLPIHKLTFHYSNDGIFALKASIINEQLDIYRRALSSCHGVVESGYFDLYREFEMRAEARQIMSIFHFLGRVSQVTPSVAELLPKIARYVQQVLTTNIPQDIVSMAELTDFQQQVTALQAFANVQGNEVIPPPILFSSIKNGQGHSPPAPK